MTQKEHNGDVYSHGAVSRSGLGDGGYDLFVSKNSNGEIVSAYISFMEEDELK